MPIPKPKLSNFHNVKKYCLTCEDKLVIKCRRDLQRKNFCSHKCTAEYTHAFGHGAVPPVPTTETRRKIGRTLSSRMHAGTIPKPPVKQPSVLSVEYCHRKAWLLFGKNVCERCSKTNEDNIRDSGNRLHMHCKSSNYRKFIKDNWECLCNACHNIKHNKAERMRRIKENAGAQS